MFLRCRDLWDRSCPCATSTRCYVVVAFCSVLARVLHLRGATFEKIYSKGIGVQKFLQSILESKDSRLHIQFCVEMQCGQGCEIERIWHVGKDLQVKNTKTSVFLMYRGQKMNASTTVNSWKRLQSHANTNKNASHVKMRMSQNPGRVAKLQTEMLEKMSNCAGSLRAAWPFFSIVV